jgi:ABC-2 type transport system ATP-binding protein
VVHDHVHIQTSDSDKTFYALLDQGLRPQEIEISALGLEQAFIAITERDDDEADAAERQDAR